eukprot:1697938-Heterocapsa_arctica.AAC.1
MLAVTPSELKKGLKEIMEEMKLTHDMMRIEADEIGKSFVLNFLGDGVLAARRAKKFMMSLKSNGEWRDLCASTPDGIDTKIFLDGDKNRKQIRKEVIARKLVKVLKE